jgi:phenylalanyl-tRNA synthetase beta chain
MKVSLSWVRFIDGKYQCSADPAPDGVDRLVEKIGAQLGAVEEVIDFGKKYTGIVVAKVVSCEKHPNADKLSLCMIDDGRVVKEVDRNEQGMVQVVCGAPNVAAGQLVAWIPPGVTVPATYDKDPFVLEAREIRGKVSNGMLASPKELALGDTHEGILVIEEDVRPGQPFVELYELNDYVIDIENKMFTHRPDLFGQLGIARELAGIQSHVFKSPDWYKEEVSIPAPKNGRLELKVENRVPELVPRFCMLVMKNVTVKPSPMWLQVKLIRAGVRPINNVVDITNFYMLETAQPLHAYDYDKVKSMSGNETSVVVRMSEPNEELRIIGGKNIKLQEGVVIIATDKKAIGLGGVMGGAETEVDENTKNIIVEVGSFDMNITRKTSMTYGLFTDAATRFTKGQSPLQNKAVMAIAVEDVCRLAGGSVASELFDLTGDVKENAPVNTTLAFINDRLGLNLAAAQIKSLLENVEFEVTLDGDSISIKAPFGRTDIEIPEDIVEEVGRLYGYDHLSLTLPKRDLTPAVRDQTLEFKSKIREILVKAGANEVLTYSFVNGALLEKVGQDPANSYHIKNALSPNLQYYRQSLTPSLLEKVHPNIKLGFDKFAIFEIGKAHVKGLLDDEDLPKELEWLSLVLAAKKNQKGAAFYEAKKICEYLLHELGTHNAIYDPLDPKANSKTVTYYEPARAANIKVGDKIVGRIGEYKPSVTASLKLPAYSAGFELHIDELINEITEPTYYPLNRYPEIEQDICLKVKSDLTYEQVTSFVLVQLGQISKEHGYNHWLRPVDIFRREDDNVHKQITWRIILSHPERTLTTEEANKALDEIAEAAKKELDAERI